MMLKSGLCQKLDDLEDFHDVAVGRELKIKGMEEEVERLKEELKKKG